MNKAMYLQPQNNNLWLNGSETILDFILGLIFTGLPSEFHLPVVFPTADASFSNLSEKAVTHKQEQISLACRKGKLLAEINLQMLEFHRKELIGREGLISCPVAPPHFPAPSPCYLYPFWSSPSQAGCCWGLAGPDAQRAWRGGGLRL